MKVNNMYNPVTMDLYMKFFYHISLIVICLFLFVNNAHAVYCYECDSSLDMTCGETLAEGHIFKPKNCSHLQEPLFCVKMTGLYEVSCLVCYQCDSTKGDFCPERITPIQVDAGYVETDFHAKSCENIFEAQYCVKTTGLYQGELGTKRFCSARDFGNYCEMVRRPGDERQYRACIYTCSDHNCNTASSSQLSYVTMVSSLAASINIIRKVL